MVSGRSARATTARARQRSPSQLHQAERHRRRRPPVRLGGCLKMVALGLVFKETYIIYTFIKVWCTRRLGPRADCNFFVYRPPRPSRPLTDSGTAKSGVRATGRPRTTFLYSKRTAVTRSLVSLIEKRIHVLSPHYGSTSREQPGGVRFLWRCARVVGGVSGFSDWRLDGGYTVTTHTRADFKPT